MSSASSRHHRLRTFIRDYLLRRKGSVGLAALSTLTIATMDLLKPWPLKIIIDYILLESPIPDSLAWIDPVLQRGDFIALVILSASILAIAGIGAAASYAQLFVTSLLGNRLVHALQRELFGHLQRLSLGFHSRARSGELLTRLASDTRHVKGLFSDVVIIFATEFVTLFAMLLVMFRMSWKLSAMIAATFPVLLYCLFRLYRRARISSHKQRKQEARIATRIAEVMSAVRLAKAFGRERYEEQRFVTESEEYLEESLRNARIEAGTLRAVDVITALGTATVVLFGSWLALQGEMEVGSVIVFLSYLKGLYRPVRHLGRLSTKLSRSMTSYERLAAILEEEPETPDRPGAIDVRSLRGEIVFDDVWFDYGDGTHVLEAVSFSIAPGEHVALVGPSGAGKSTLVSLILRLYDPQRGRILIDGVDIRDYRRESLRREIGIVLQETHLFGTTIRENIAYGRLEARETEIVEAARLAHAHTFIEAFSDGYETVMGERGQTLSRGQRQRIAIARALIRRPSILILDEPMTGLDPESRNQVQEALDNLTRDRTCLTITHDLRSAERADRVILLEKGKVAGLGTAREMMESADRYRRLREIDSAAGGMRTSRTP